MLEKQIKVYEGSGMAQERRERVQRLAKVADLEKRAAEKGAPNAPGSSHAVNAGAPSKEGGLGGVPS